MFLKIAVFVIKNDVLFNPWTLPILLPGAGKLSKLAFLWYQYHALNLFIRTHDRATQLFSSGSLPVDAQLPT